MIYERRVLRIKLLGKEPKPLPHMAKDDDDLLWDFSSTSLREGLSSHGVEPDQHLVTAFESAWRRNPGPLNDNEVLYQLARLNTGALRDLLREPEAFEAAFKSVRVQAPESALPTAYPSLQRVLARSLQYADSGTLSTRAFLKSIAEGCINPDRDDGRFRISFGMLTKFFERTAGASANQQLDRFLQKLSQNPATHSDFEFILALEDSRIVFRPTSVLDDYVQESGSGLYQPRRALLTHFREQFGGVTADEILELEDLLNSKVAREADFQTFFDTHPHFLRRWDHREVHSQVYLTREDDGPLIPDFILTDQELQRATILDLKLPSPKLIRRQHNRDRFAAAIQEARAQLLTYRDWFDDAANRHRLKESVGMEIYKPHLAVIIGRSVEFRDEVDRALLESRTADIEVLTYDDILIHAQRRRVIIGSEDAEQD